MTRSYVSILLSYVGKSLSKVHKFACDYYAALSANNTTTKNPQEYPAGHPPFRAESSARRPRPFTDDDNAPDSVLRTKSKASRWTRLERSCIDR